MSPPFQRLLPFFLGITLCLPSARAQATLKGTVKLPPPPSGKIATPKYQGKISGPVAAPEPPSAVVYLEGTFPPPAGALPKAELGQRDYQFETSLLPIRKGTTVEFPNHDEDYHNVFSYSKTKKFDLGRYKKDEKPPSQRFDQPGPIKLFCEIHQHMRATILVLDTPYFVKTDPAGAFILTNLPAGTFTAKAWLDEKTILEKQVVVPASGMMEIQFQP